MDSHQMGLPFSLLVPQGSPQIPPMTASKAERKQVLRAGAPAGCPHTAAPRLPPTAVMLTWPKHSTEGEWAPCAPGAACPGPAMATAQSLQGKQDLREGLEALLTPGCGTHRWSLRAHCTPWTPQDGPPRDPHDVAALVRWARGLPITASF